MTTKSSNNVNRNTNSNNVKSNKQGAYIKEPVGPACAGNDQDNGVPANNCSRSWLIGPDTATELSGKARTSSAIVKARSVSYNVTCVDCKSVESHSEEEVT